MAQTPSNAASTSPEAGQPEAGQPDAGQPEPGRSVPPAPAVEGDQVGPVRAGLTALSHLTIADVPLLESLTEVARLALRAIPGADGVGLNLAALPPGDKSTAKLTSAPGQSITTASFVREITELQQSTGEGPAMPLTTGREILLSGSLGGDERWPRFGPRAGRLGVHSVLVLPLTTADAVVGALTAYAHRRHAFDVTSADVGSLFATQATVVVQNALALEQARRLAGGLQAAADHRALINQALGIIRSRTGCSSEEAYGRLRGLSQTGNAKLGVVAQQLIDEAVRRANARRAKS